ncbi:MAG TPA: hypothetical protein DEP28_00145 [Bacteroidetes bacterium]|nr:hypothetical protein [Bacteroidota bacterium]HRI46914.1 hypothetical protein [Ignavibacteriaceae bacterium]
MKKKSGELTQLEIANIIGCSREYLNRVITGKENSLLADFVYKEYCKIEPNINLIKFFVMEGVEDAMDLVIESRKNKAAKKFAIKFMEDRDRFLKWCFDNNVKDKINKILDSKSKT